MLLVACGDATGGGNGVEADCVPFIDLCPPHVPPLHRMSRPQLLRHTALSSLETMLIGDNNGVLLCPSTLGTTEAQKYPEKIGRVLSGYPARTGQHHSNDLTLGVHFYTVMASASTNYLEDYLPSPQINCLMCSMVLLNWIQACYKSNSNLISSFFANKKLYMLWRTTSTTD
ncbi:uncharacterized protein [Aegilops tauschii subsp. strangulata]|uniref:uncharacterized protein n=1 Tax=Aegilops tauschii subsp. strangulata TaxID=200361 RepID=UPI001ABC24C6|nr:uncharacterized protein LOC109786794 [Aegilops tauschii subsp. strangulata]